MVPFPNTKEARWPVSVAGGSEPAWSRDGRELVYRYRRGYMVAVRVETESGFSARETTTLFADTAFERRDREVIEIRESITASTIQSAMPWPR